MGSRKRNRPRNRKLRTVEHFRSTHPDEVNRIESPPGSDAPLGRRWTHRLTWSPPIVEHEFDVDYFVDMVDQPFNRDVVYFLDANMFLAPTDERIWEALLGKRGRLAIAEPILSELNAWFGDESVVNPIARAALRRTCCHEPVDILRIVRAPPPFTPAGTALGYYAQLLGIRKRGYEFARGLLKMAGVMNVDRQAASNACANIFGDRTQRLARERKDSNEPLNLNDEKLIILALEWSLFHQREIVIWTRDEGVLEQFYKAVWLIDTHYRAWLAGSIHNADSSRFKSRTVTSLDCQTESSRSMFDMIFADGSITLIDIPSKTLKELLPERFSMISWHCCLFKGDKVTQLSFAADDVMQRVFEVKGCTGGLSCGLFEPRNVHVWLGPLVDEFGVSGAIAHDRGIPFDAGHIAGLDVLLSLHCREGISHVIYGEHPDHLTPP